jgi:predicted kinase
MNLKKLTKYTQNKPYVIILIGPPLSGKDYFANKFKKEIDSSVEIISRDQVLLDLHVNDDYDEAYRLVNQRHVTSQFNRLLSDVNRRKENVLVNMTHLASSRREHNLNFFDDDYYKIALIFPFLSEDEYEKRYKKRSFEEKGRFRTTVNLVKSMIAQYQPIRMEEGFHKIISL